MGVSVPGGGSGFTSHISAPQTSLYAKFLAKLFSIFNVFHASHNILLTVFFNKSIVKFTQRSVPPMEFHSLFYQALCTDKHIQEF